jgi:hypothetical protein
MRTGGLERLFGLEQLRLLEYLIHERGHARIAQFV